MPLPLYLLAVAVFAMGTSEFMLAGLLPDIASDLDVTVGTAGVLTSAFAIGMIAGAPLVAALARNWPRRVGLLGFVLVFAAAHAVGAVTTSFPLLFATRVSSDRPAPQPEQRPDCLELVTIRRAMPLNQPSPQCPSTTRRSSACCGPTPPR